MYRAKTLAFHDHFGGYGDIYKLPDDERSLEFSHFSWLLLIPDVYKIIENSRLGKIRYSKNYREQTLQF